MTSSARMVLAVLFAGTLAEGCADTTRDYGDADAGASGGAAGSSGAAGNAHTSGGSAGAVNGAGAGGEAGSSSECPEDHVLDAETDDCRPVLTQLQVEAETPSDASLLDPLEPALSTDLFSYRVETSFWLTELSLQLGAPSGATFELNGEPMAATAVLSLVPGDNEFSITVQTNSGSSAYALTVHRPTPIRIAEASGDRRFGSSVAITGDLLVVGAPASDGGRVHTFRRAGPGKWEEETPTLSADPSFGATVALDGTSLAVGASSATVGDVERAGAVHFYRRAEAAWEAEQVTHVTAPVFAREIGYQVALSGTSAASASDNLNELYTWTRDSGGVWRESSEGVLAAPDGIAFIEGVVALDGGWLAAGVHNGDLGPAVYLYTRTSTETSWMPPASGDSVLQATGMFADAVALRGRTLVVNGEPVRAFERDDDGTWSNAPLPVDSLGPLALTDTTLVVGAHQDQYNGALDGQVQVFRRSTVDAAWQADPSSPLPTVVGESEGFGAAVATDGRTIVVGAPSEPLGGAIYVYD